MFKLPTPNFQTNTTVKHNDSVQQLSTNHWTRVSNQYQNRDHENWKNQFNNAPQNRQNSQQLSVNHRTRVSHQYHDRDREVWKNQLNNAPQNGQNSQQSRNHRTHNVMSHQYHDRDHGMHGMWKNQVNNPPQNEQKYQQLSTNVWTRESNQYQNRGHEMWKNQINNAPQNGQKSYYGENNTAHNRNHYALKHQYEHNSWRKPYNNGTQRHERKSEFSCERCSKWFADQRLYDYHCAQHIKCGLDGCPFEAMPNVIAFHQKMQHFCFKDRSVVKKFMCLDTPEEIAKWRDERRNNYPTKAIVLAKKAKAVESRLKPKLKDKVKRKAKDKVKRKGNTKTIPKPQPRKLTLFEKLMLTDVKRNEHEIMECMKVIVDNNFLQNT